MADVRCMISDLGYMLTYSKTIQIIHQICHLRSDICHQPPIDGGLDNEISQYYTKAYLRHLFTADEILGMQLASIQNLSFYLSLVGEARQLILAGDFSSWKTAMTEHVKRRL